MSTGLTQVPDAGKKMAQHLINARYPDVASLKGQDPEEIYTIYRRSGRYYSMFKSEDFEI